ncbi:MAG: hypothetical protein VX438_01110, partial [Planctomycetota bacterium]|nr:hypothetical protein [Planctomycetota bacterium]
IPIQIKGKIKAKINVPPGTDKDQLERLARENDAIRELLENSELIKVIVVPDRMVNFVVKS